MKTGEALRGVARLGFDTVEGVTHIVEGMYRNIAARPMPLGRAPEGPANGIAGFVHESIRRVNGAVRHASELALNPVAHQIDRAWPTGPHREAAIAALNGVCGDYLERSDNSLAIQMRFRVFLPRERPVEIYPQPTASADPEFSPGGRLLILAHGLCMNDREWTAREHNHAQMLAETSGYTPVYLLYNSGRHISTSGREFCAQLAGLLDAWPVAVESITIIGFSMGGLLARSALHIAQQERQAWLGKVDKVAYVGTPHQGVVMERGGYWLQKSATYSPYTAPLSALGRIRSAGITDLRHGNVLDDDWQHHDEHEDNSDHRQSAPLLSGIDHYAIASTLSKQPGERIGKLLGDGLVHPSSAIGSHQNPDLNLAFPEAHTRTFYGLAHLAMLHDPRVAEQLSEWLN
jgi:pimeloyl-ACP methyl ester carboxylesterase